MILTQNLKSPNFLGKKHPICKAERVDILKSYWFTSNFSTSDLRGSCISVLLRKHDSWKKNFTQVHKLKPKGKRPRFCAWSESNQTPWAFNSSMSQRSHSSSSALRCEKVECPIRSKGYQRHFGFGHHIYDPGEFCIPTFRHPHLKACPWPQGGAKWATLCWDQPSPATCTLQLLVAASNHTWEWGKVQLHLLSNQLLE